MSHRAALYTVRVKKKYTQDYRLLGDIDEAGSGFAAELERSFKQFVSQSPDDGKLVQSQSVTSAGDELLVVMQHGESGLVADIVDQSGSLQHRQTATETQLMRCGALFALPPEQDRGWLALHVNNGRGIKSLLEIGLLKEFANRFDDLALEIQPFIQSGALREAVDQGRIATVRLIKYEAPDDRAVAATDKWIPAGEWGSIEVQVKGRRGHRLAPGPLRKFLDAQSQQKNQAFSEIVEFEGMVFDEAKVEVQLENGTRRTFNIESPTSGHAMTIDMEGLKLDDDGEPTEDSIFNGLRDALTSVR